jgi:hypothetical protein
MRGARFTPWLLVATLTAAGAAAAAGYGLTAPKRYQATAQLLVTPLAATDPTFAGLGVLREVSGRPRAAATAAALVRSPQIADAVRTQLGVRRSVSSLEDEVHAHAAGASDVVDVTVEDTSATTAAQLANVFVDALIAQRTAAFQHRLGAAIHRTAVLIAGGSAGPQTVEFARRLAVLRSFQGQPDPTLHRASSAVAPTSASWPVLWRLVLIGAGIGLALGALAAAALLPSRRRGLGTAPQAVDALVDRLERRLAARESALAVRERELQAKIDELRALDPNGARDDSSQARAALRAKEAELEARLEAVRQREAAVARAAADALARSVDTARDTSSQAGTPAPTPAGAFNLAAIERLVAERGAEHPERRDEWESTVHFLRDHAGPDGTLPGSFDWLVQETFAPLLD